MRKRTLEKLTNIIEAILFAAGDAVPIELLREKLDVSKREVDSAIAQLEKKYTGDCGIRLLNFNHKNKQNFNFLYNKKRSFHYKNFFNLFVFKLLFFALIV